MAARWNSVAILGVGLIGGSIGLALLERRLARNVIGIGRRPESLAKSKALGAVTATSLGIEEGVAEADLAIVCTPVTEIAGHVLQAAAAAPEQSILTDAGSTKESIVKKVDAKIGRNNRFVGSHPLAGSEKNGVDNARADLFEGRVVVVTPSRKTNPEHLTAVADFWSGLGATVLLMSPAEHDKALATTSHLPHLIASAVARETSQAELPLTAGGWRDLTRIAASDPELWTQILLENRGHVLKSLTGFEKTVAAFRTALEQGDRRKLQKLLREGKEVRDAVGN
jgi:prephenate dehydrogenase